MTPILAQNTNIGLCPPDSPGFHTNIGLCPPDSPDSPDSSPEYQYRFVSPGLPRITPRITGLHPNKLEKLVVAHATIEATLPK